MIVTIIFINITKCIINHACKYYFLFFQPIVTSEAPTKKENTAEDTVKNEKKEKKKEKSKKSSENEQKVEEVEEESENIRDTKQKEVDDSKVKADYGFLKDPKALKCIHDCLS